MSFSPDKIFGEQLPYQSNGYKSTAIPIVNFNSDDGAGYGVRAFLYNYDGKSIPYQRQYSIQTFFTTGGKWVHRLLIDAPNIFPKYRIELEAKFEKQEKANYFGTGKLSDLELESFDEAQKTYQFAKPSLRLLVIRQLNEPWRWRGDLEINHMSIKSNSARNSILMHIDPPTAGRNGGLLIQARGALHYDTRNDYSNTSSGVFEELLFEYGSGKSGRYNGGRMSVGHRHFHALFPNIVIAHHANADVTFGSVPFYESLTLGGGSTVRGLNASRLQGEGRLLFNTELRWRGINLSRNQHIFMGLLTFADIGQIFQRRKGPSLNNWRGGFGLGLRLLWHSTVVRADWGRSGQHTGLYITFDQVF